MAHREACSFSYLKDRSTCQLRVQWLLKSDFSSVIEFGQHLSLSNRTIHLKLNINFFYRAVIFIESEQNDIVWLLHFYPFNKHIWFAILGIFAAGSLSLILITSHLRYINSQRHLIILFPIFYTLQILCFQSKLRFSNNIF